MATFMNSGMTSILTVLAEGKSVEVGLTGKDGFVGLPLIVGFSSGPTQAVVQIAGSAFSIGARAIGQIVRQCPALANRLQRYVQMLAMQGTQVAACNRLHEVDERLARWLLMCQDRIGSNLVPLTQEFLAHMLGTRRASVTVAAGILQKAGLITYSARAREHRRPTPAGRRLLRMLRNHAAAGQKVAQRRGRGLSPIHTAMSRG